MYWVYILQSTTTQRYYCGYTDDLDRRLKQHNDPDYHGTRTTKVFSGPWELIWQLNKIHWQGR
ncbi:GIY-YIG nuclease family protein [Desulfosudis oleivorans]|uniref:GIY-YIG nuclease family protein n=1 Tax=Desulfosudis oleivorans TaxID=181663 RepID=UPI000A04CBC4